MQKPSLQNRSKNLMKKETFTISSTSFKKSSPGTTVSESWNQGWKASWFNPRQCNYDYEEAEEYKNDGEDEDENEDEDEDDDDDDEEEEEEDDGAGAFGTTIPFLAVPATSWGDNARHKANGPQGDQKALLGWISVAIFLKACMCCLVSSQIILYKYELNQKVLKNSTDVETPPFKYTKMLQHDTAAGRSLRIRLSTSALTEASWTPQVTPKPAEGGNQPQFLMIFGCRLSVKFRCPVYFNVWFQCFFTHPKSRISRILLYIYIYICLIGVTST